LDELEKYAEPQRLLTLLEQIRDWLIANVLTTATLGQVGAIVVAFIIARLLAPSVRAWIDSRIINRFAELRGKHASYVLLALTLPMLWLAFEWLAMLILGRIGLPTALLRIVTSLLAAWVIIRFTASLVRDPLWSTIVAVTAWSLAAMNILGILDDATAILDHLAIDVGKVHVSALAVLKGALLLGLLLWAANRLSALAERRMTTLPRLTPSLQLLFSKLLKIGLFAAAVLVALGSIGIDITALAVFTGAVGVGIGFGLQAMVSNFVAGIILLVERSLKIGDFVELPSGVRGEVREINIRNTVVTTNDNIDIIVPNSEFVNGAVTNWTFQDNYRRLRVPFGVAYGTDKELVRKAGLEAAAAVAFTQTDMPARQPQVWLVAFGDSSLNFELVVWLKPEAVKRPAAVNAAYCWALETALSNHGIEIPFPQRDLHIRSAATLRFRADPHDVRQEGDKHVHQLLP
jgi:small-conductance mechanosensitive channel